MEANDVKRVVVVGAGVMGHSIAQAFAQAGIDVNLVDVNENILNRAIRLIKGNLETLAEHGRVKLDALPAILSRIHPATDLTVSCGEVDFAIEAVAEVPDVKKAVFKQLEEYCPEDTVLASNTSALDIFEIVEVQTPERLVTAHWFAPPHIIPLVEIAPGPRTSPEVVAFTAQLMERVGKKPLVMKAFVPGFIVNRIQRAIGEAVFELLANGWATPEEIDIAVKNSIGIRMPIVGVIQCLDFAGLDLVNDINKSLEIENPYIEDKVRQGHFGVKTSKGIYDYGGRTEAEILKKRDELYLKNLDHFESIKAFEPV